MQRITVVTAAAFPVVLVTLASMTTLGTGTAGCSGDQCTDLAPLSESDLSCNTDQDCTLVLSGTVCACGCNCPSTAANIAASTRVSSQLTPMFQSANCSNLPCQCPAQWLARCLAHQCTTCGNPAFGRSPGQPAACDVDSGQGDATDSGFDG